MVEDTLEMREPLHAKFEQPVSVIFIAMAS
jgi:hypothetical protein